MCDDYSWIKIFSSDIYDISSRSEYWEKIRALTALSQTILFLPKFFVVLNLLILSYLYDTEQKSSLFELFYRNLDESFIFVLFSIKQYYFTTVSRWNGKESSIVIFNSFFCLMKF